MAPFSRIATINTDLCLKGLWWVEQGNAPASRGLQPHANLSQLSTQIIKADTLNKALMGGLVNCCSCLRSYGSKGWIRTNDLRLMRTAR